MTNGIINSLRTQYLDLMNWEADCSVRYGKNHTAVVNLRNQIRDIRRSIRDEFGRIEETFKSEYEIAKKRQDELEKGARWISYRSQQRPIRRKSHCLVSKLPRRVIASSTTVSFSSTPKSVQQQSFPITDARLLSPASVTKTGPQTLQVWMLALLAGGMLGVGFGALRELLDRGFRTRDQVRSVLNTECLAHWSRCCHQWQTPAAAMNAASGEVGLPRMPVTTGLTDREAINSIQHNLADHR